MVPLGSGLLRATWGSGVRLRQAPADNKPKKKKARVELKLTNKTFGDL